MSIKREKIKFIGFDINIPITLDVNDNLSGFQQEIDNFTKIESANSINEGNDVEVRRFYMPLNNVFSEFYFWNGSTYNSLYSNAGFTSEEISGYNSNFLNSYYTLDFYDSFDTNTQNRIFSAYLTKLKKNGIDSYEEIDNTSELYKLEVPISYFSDYSGNTITGYTRFSFYNAKSGKIQLFYNEDNEGLTTAEKFYFKTTFDISGMTWNVLTPSMLPSTKYMNAFELKPEENQAYINKYNETFENFDNLNQTYPTGNTFAYSGGTYINT